MFLTTSPRKLTVRFLIAVGLAVVAPDGGAYATAVSGTITAIMNGSTGYPTDQGGYFYPTGTSLVGKSMTITYSYNTSGTGITYTNGTDSSLLSFSNAAAGSFVMTLTANNVTYTLDGSSNGSIDVDHNGSPSRYDFDINLPNGFFYMNNLTSTTAYNQGILGSPLTNPIGSGFYLYESPNPNSDFVGLQNMTATGSGATAVPEPSSLALSGFAFAALVFYRRRQQARAI